MSSPSVSIIIPTYNRGLFIRRAIDSVQQQTWPDYELIVVDDGSTDDTPAILRKLEKTEARLRVVDNARGRHGPAGARNTGLAEARGEWVAFLDSDDVWKPEKLARFMSEAADDVVLIASDYHIIEDESENGQTMWDFIETVMIPWWANDPIIQPVIPAARLKTDRQLLANPDVIRGMTIGGYLWPQTSSVMVKRSEVEEAGNFNAQLARTEDMDLWLKLLDAGRFVYVDQPLAFYHIQGRDNGRGARYDTLAPDRKHDSYQEMLAHLRILKSLPRRFPLKPEARTLLRERIRVYHEYCAKAAGGQRPMARRWHQWRSHQ